MLSKGQGSNQSDKVSNDEIRSTIFKNILKLPRFTSRNTNQLALTHHVKKSNTNTESKINDSNEQSDKNDSNMAQDSYIISSGIRPSPKSFFQRKRPNDIKEEDPSLESSSALLRNSINNPDHDDQ